MNSFNDFGLLDSISRTLKSLRINKPTEIQTQAMPLMLSGQSVVGISETGSGKTLTYALPILHILKLLEHEEHEVTDAAKPRAVVVVPTRDLGEQVAKVFKQFTHDTRLRVRAALGGMAFEQVRRNVGSPFEILLATPGRLVQLIQQDLIDLSDVHFLVFDEADQMLDQGFLNDSDLIIETCTKDITLALFSATISKTVQDLINIRFSQAEVVRSSGSGKTAPTLKTSNRTVEDGKRWPLFEKILKEKYNGGTLIFTNTREQCDKLAQELRDKGYPCAIYRGEMDKNERRSNLKKFRTGEIKLLVSTDLAARGLDISYVERVINFHLPEQLENYLHRAGRTARAGKPGLVINLVTERDQRLIDKIAGKKVLAKRIPNTNKKKPMVKTKDKADSNKAAAPKAPTSKAMKYRPPLSKTSSKAKHVK